MNFSDPIRTYPLGEELARDLLINADCSANRGFPASRALARPQFPGEGWPGAVGDASIDWEQEGDPVFVEDMTISAERDGRPASVSSVPSAHVNRLGNRLRYVAAPGPGDPGTKGHRPEQAPPPLTRSDNQGGINV